MKKVKQEHQKIENKVNNSESINNLPNTDEKIIDKYIKQISTELYHLSKDFEAKGDTNAHINARHEINKKYGKFWRERLNSKKIYNSPNPFGKISYY